MANEKRLIDANKLNVCYINTGTVMFPKIEAFVRADDIADAPTVDAVEVVMIKEVNRKILETLDTLIAPDAELANYAEGNSYYRGKVNAYEVAKILVNAALTDLAKMDGGNEDV